MTSNTLVISIGMLTAALFVGLGMLHAYWALGQRNPSMAVIPVRAGRPLFTPRPTGTLLVALALLSCALLVLGTLGIWRMGLPGWLFKIGTWGVATAFLLRAIGDFRYVGFFKKVRATPFARNDSWFYSPLCLCIAVSCAMLAAFA